MNYKQCVEAPVCLSDDFIPHHETNTHKCSSLAVTNMILQVTNTEVRRSDEAQLAGDGIIYKDKKAAAQLNTSSYQKLIWYGCDQWCRNYRGSKGFSRYTF